MTGKLLGRGGGVVNGQKTGLNERLYGEGFK